MKLQTINTAEYLERGTRYSDTHRELYLPFSLTIQSYSVEEPEGYSYGDYWINHITVRVKFERHTSKKLIKEVLSSYFTTKVGCGHSYDCCGCVSVSAWHKEIVHLKRNEYYIRQSASVNR